MSGVKLIGEDGQPFDWRPGGRSVPVVSRPGFSCRRAFAAAHVVANPHGSDTPLDWEATLAFRRHLWQLGLGVAEAMDTAQRGMGLHWEIARELIVRTAREAGGAPVVYGAGTDQIPAGSVATVPSVVEAYREQVDLVESVGGQAILMASRALAAIARSAEDYLEVYGKIVSEASRPVMIHWLGEVFDPALAGYWGSRDPWIALETVLAVVGSHPERVDGVKISLLDDRLERAMRGRLPTGVRTYTGDDFNFPDLILGDEKGHSDALLGVFDPIAPVASAALQSLDEGDRERFRSILAPTLPFARHLFSEPTYHYKTGVTFLAYLNGHQRHFRMLNGTENARSVAHLSRLLVLADEAGLLVDPDLAVNRMRQILVVSGID